ncbi:hypothetical protein BD311DRAFT_772298 [Dichomitus squalens]|uniref:DUF6535 domain-containing protein n=2 Tax=Dichomitus squalens TaxID=114155 RepID=A0A4Q9M6R7_9APHY|nr:hypothetical protein BD311DRAFT_772298 [Dichomitus squalens]
MPSINTELQEINADSQPTPEQGQERSSSPIASDSPSATPQPGDVEGQNAPDGGYVSTTPFPWKLPSVEDLRKEFSETYTQAEKDSALEKTAEVVKQYSDEMVKRWKEEIDTLLVYAGLFSAILTAFNVQSYILLQSSTPDPTLAVLQQISLQLNSFSVTPPGTLVNSTHPITSFAPIPMALVETWAVWLNSLWFSALICSLASASVGILVKQWLHEYEAGISGTSLEIARLRQYRLNHLAKWRVAEIIAILPVLLQVSLALFLTGLLVLLWHLHPTVATITSTLIGVLLSFAMVTTVMPVFWRDCCYLSPPTYAIFRVVHRIHFLVTSLRGVFRALYHHCGHLSRSERLPGIIRSWCSHLSDWACHQDWDPVTVPTWRGRERTDIQESSSKLDVDMIIEAYSTTMDVKHLSDAAGAILADKDVDNIAQCFDEIEDISGRHFGKGVVAIRSPNFWAGVLIHASRKKASDALTRRLYGYSNLYRDNMKSGHHERLLLALAATVANPDSGSAAHSWSLLLLNELFTFNPAALELMPWKAVRHVAAATELQLRQLLHPSDGEPAPERDSHVVFRSMGILVRCCFAPVPSWTRSQEETKASMACIFGIYVPWDRSLCDELTLRLWEDILRYDPANLEVIPWKLVRPVVAVAEMRLRQLLHPSDGEPSQEPDWHVVFRWLWILVRCCFAPVSSWTRSQEETKASMACIFGMNFLHKGSISKIAGQLWSSFAIGAILETLDIILTYLCESEDVRRGASGDFLNAVGELVKYVEGATLSYSWYDDDVQEALKKLKRSMERCKFLRLGVQAEEVRMQASPLDTKPESSAIGEHPEGH